MHTYNFKDLTGQRFGRLVVVKESELRKSNRVTWHCKCDCGKEKDIISKDLVSGKSKSCGCGVIESTIKRSTKHGMAHKHVYDAWMGMKDRCRNPNNTHYHIYGARGISVCEEWLDFETFYNQFGKHHKKGLSIDRIDNNEGYCLDNCRWATPEEQSSNTSRNVFYTVDGVTDTLQRLSNKYSIDPTTVTCRIRRGWDIERSFKEKPNLSKNR